MGKNEHSFSKVSAGAFASLGLNSTLCKAILKKGYKQGTPIQRKCIPLLLEGKDVIGMARTGSGKTAAFVLPMLQNLRSHSAKTGVRGLILAPSRELALQTLKFTQQMARFTDLRVAALIGGDGLEEQFASLASNPDIVVATPGRLLHVCIEAKLNLKTVSMVVWDEADRLLEDPSMAEQLKEIMLRCPVSKQIALFSATMPQVLADYARVGLVDPVVVKLDAESQLSPDLETIFLSIQSETRDAHLIYLLEKISQSNKKTVVFAATKHHVEYLQELLTIKRIPCVYIYGSLDQVARESAIEQFRAGKKPILVVTDVASRGIDVPILDVVINYDFPASPKLFVHRVGRVARAGRKGTAYSFVGPDEIPYLYDLSLFLEQPISVLGRDQIEDKSIALGSIKQSDIDTEVERLRNLYSMNSSLESLKKVVSNAYKLYKKSRVSASAESHRRAKEIQNLVIGLHPKFFNVNEVDNSEISMLTALKSFKPKQSFLEMTNLQASKTAPVPGKKRMATMPSNENKYKDESSYLSYKQSDSSKESSSGQLSFGRLAANTVFDIKTASSRRDELIKTGTMLSTKMKKRAASSKKKDNVKMIKTEFGTSVPASYKAGSYEKWCARTRLSIQKPGETESQDTSTRAMAIVTDGASKRKWRKPVTKKTPTFKK